MKGIIVLIDWGRSKGGGALLRSLKLKASSIKIITHNFFPRSPSPSVAILNFNIT